MKWLFIILIILLFLFILILVTKLTIYINFFHHNDDDDLKIELRLWHGLIKYKIKIPLIKIDDNSPSIVVKQDPSNSENPTNQITTDEVVNSIKNFREILDHIVHLKEILKGFMKKISLKQFEWYSVVGIGDAAITGMASGAIWTIKGSVIGALSHFLRMKEIPKIMVTPEFNQTILQTRITCIFQFRIGNAMLAGIKLFRFWKGGRPNLKSNTILSKDKTKSV